MKIHFGFDYKNFKATLKVTARKTSKVACKKVLSFSFLKTGVDT